MDRQTLRITGVVAAGGVLGALARYAIGVAWPHAPAAFPWSTWTINVTGCFLIGVLVTSLDRWRPHQRYTRPFLGTGFLAGYTTFSTAIVDLQHAAPGVAIVYLGASVVGALVAVWAGSALAGLGWSR